MIMMIRKELMLYLDNKDENVIKNVKNCKFTNILKFY
jgi:hypothetical protein